MSNFKQKLAANLETTLINLQPASKLSLDFLQSIAKKLRLNIKSKVIVVTGTNGKGSVIKLLETIYLQAGFSVAATTSPHLSDFCERLTIDGDKVNPGWVVEALQQVEAAGLRYQNYFAYIYFALLLCIQRANPEVAILEVGIGGRLDVNNVLDADVAVITSIGLDHVSLLGETREAIAFEKAHIARKNRPLVCGEPDRPVTINQVVSDVGANLYSINKDFFANHNDDSWSWRFEDKVYPSLPIPKTKQQNAATALMVIDLLQKKLPVSYESIATALHNFIMPARFERLFNVMPCEVVLDVAHNPQSMEWLSCQLADLHCDGKTVALIGMKQDKNILESLKPLLNVVDEWVAVPIEHPQTCDPQEIIDVLATAGIYYCYTCSSLANALKSLMLQLGSHDRLIITGSFFLVGAARDSLKEVDNVRFN